MDFYIISEENIDPLLKIGCIFFDENEKILGNPINLRDFINLSGLSLFKHGSAYKKPSYELTTHYYYFLPNKRKGIYNVFSENKEKGEIEITSIGSTNYIDLIFISEYIFNTFQKSR